MATVDFSTDALEDLYRIWNYGRDNWGAKAADQYYVNLHAHFDELAQYPLSYPAVDHIRKGYRRSTCQQETIYYMRKLDGVKIMAVIGRQDLTPRL